MASGATILTCPKCGPGWRLWERINKVTGEKFLACERWPHCDYRQEIPEHVRMEQAGVPRLPGF